MGRGPDVGGDVILKYDNINPPHPISSMNFNADMQDAYWEFTELQGLHLCIQSVLKNLSQ